MCEQIRSVIVRFEILLWLRRCETFQALQGTGPWAYSTVNARPRDRVAGKIIYANAYNSKVTPGYRPYPYVFPQPRTYSGYSRVLNSNFRKESQNDSKHLKEAWRGEIIFACCIVTCPHPPSHPPEEIKRFILTSLFQHCLHFGSAYCSACRRHNVDINWLLCNCSENGINWNKFKLIPRSKRLGKT